MPQGSVIGPLLLTLFINDITDLFDSPTVLALFADDIKIYAEITLPHHLDTFQFHLDAIYSWAKTWQIGISYAKCNFITIGASLSPTPKINLAQHEILKSDSIRDLGVQIDCKLNFKTHTNDIVGRAKQRSALIFRGFLSRNTEHLTRAYISYIRPLLEYASTVWSPSLIYLIDSLESVQRSYTKRLPGYAQLPYSERLSKLKLQSLEHRRLIYDLVMCYQIVHKLNSLEFSEFFKFSNTTRTRGHNLRLDIPLIQTNTRRNFFAYRVVKPWNSLPSSIVNAPSTSSFKSRLAKVDLSTYIKFPCILPDELHRT